MALTASNLVWYGPFTITFKTAAASTKSYSGLNGDSISFGVETKVGNVVFEDGSEKNFVEGRKLTCELTFSELVTADLDSIEGCDNFTVAFDNGKTVTVGTTCEFFASVDGGKSKVTAIKTDDSAGDVADLFSIA